MILVHLAGGWGSTWIFHSYYPWGQAYCTLRLCIYLLGKYLYKDKSSICIYVGGCAIGCDMGWKKICFSLLINLMFIFSIKCLVCEIPGDRNFKEPKVTLKLCLLSDQQSKTEKYHIQQRKGANPGGRKYIFAFWLKLAETVNQLWKQLPINFLYQGNYWSKMCSAEEDCKRLQLVRSSPLYLITQNFCIWARRSRYQLQKQVYVQMSQCSPSFGKDLCEN